MTEPVECEDEAVRLRLAGFSRSQIARALGVKTGGAALSKRLQGVPAPAWTGRPRAKDELRSQAIALRVSGMSYREIAEVVPVSKSTLSAWLRDRPLSEAQVEQLRLRSGASSAKRATTLRARAASRRAAVQQSARRDISSLSDGELFVAGVVAYWAEGTKNKPWRPSEQVKFVNSDPDLVRIFLAWLRLIGVSSDRLVFRLHIHESGDADAARRFWANELGLAPGSFGNNVIKRHAVAPVRRNTTEGYHGCLAVYVRRSASLNVQIAGWCEGLTTAVAGTTQNEG